MFRVLHTTPEGTEKALNELDTDNVVSILSQTGLSLGTPATGYNAGVRLITTVTLVPRSVMEPADAK